MQFRWWEKLLLLFCTGSACNNEWLATPGNINNDTLDSSFGVLDSQDYGPRADEQVYRSNCEVLQVTAT